MIRKISGKNTTSPLKYLQGPHGTINETKEIANAIGTTIEKNSSYEFKANEIFKASDFMVDSLTQLIAKKRDKNT